MRRALTIGLPTLLLGLLCQAATLERLSLDEMTQKSTAIVRGRVTGSFTTQHGSMIYTHYRLDVSERWKGGDTAVAGVVVPGGVAGGLRQAFAGVPRLAAGREYVLFLWTGPSGLTHLIGLSQGVFNLSRDAGGDWTAYRPACAEVMLDKDGTPVHDQAVTLRLSDLRQRVGSGVQTGGRK